MMLERVQEGIYTETIAEPEVVEHYAYDEEIDLSAVPTRTNIADSMEDEAPTLRERLRTYLGRTAAALALTSAALVGSSAVSEEAEAATLQQGPVACRNNDGTTGLQLGELCLVNEQQYGNSKGPNDQVLSFILAGALGGKCQTAFYAGESAVGLYAAYALKVYKAGKFFRYTTVAGLTIGATGDALSNRICK